MAVLNHSALGQLTALADPPLSRSERPPERKRDPVNTALIEVDARRAEAMLTAWRYPMQRKLSEPYVKYLVEQIDQGTFVPETIAVAHCLGRVYLVEAQHRLHAMTRTNRVHTFALTEYDYETMEEVHEHYTIAVGTKNRTPWESPLAIEYSQDRDLTSRVMSRTLAAAALIASGFYTDRKSGHYKRYTPYERVTVLEALGDCVGRYWDTVRQPIRGRAGLLELAGVVAVGFVTFQAQPEKAEPFWHRLAHEEDLVSGEAANVLLNYVTKNPWKRSLPTMQARVAAAAWNIEYEKGRKRRDGRPTGVGETGRREYLKPRPTDMEIRIDGTRYKGEPKVRVTFPWD